MLELGGDQLGPLTPRSVLWLLCPSACAFVVTWLADGGSGVRELAGRLLRWRVPLRWYLFALFGIGATYWPAACAVTAVFFPMQLATPPLGSWALAITVLSPGSGRSSGGAGSCWRGSRGT